MSGWSNSSGEKPPLKKSRHHWRKSLRSDKDLEQSKIK